MVRVRAVGSWLAIVPIPLMLATAAQAAGDGALGATSRGSVSIIASVAARASVEGPAEVTFAGPSATSAASARALGPRTAMTTGVCLSGPSYSRSKATASWMRVTR